jgi:hypothetical protein
MMWFGIKFQIPNHKKTIEINSKYQMTRTKQMGRKFQISKIKNQINRNKKNKN